MSDRLTPTYVDGQALPAVDLNTLIEDVATKTEIHEVLNQQYTKPEARNIILASFSPEDAGTLEFTPKNGDIWIMYED